jgi:hypothetical protein
MRCAIALLRPEFEDYRQILRALGLMAQRAREVI